MIKHIMYCTLYYIGKSNQVEDSQNYLRVSKKKKIEIHFYSGLET